MSEAKLQYIYEAEEYYEESPSDESYAGPVLMGRERDYFLRRNQSVQEFIIQQSADIEAERNIKVDTSPQLFGISSQNKNQRVSLDKKFPGDMLYQVKTDNMSPYILPKTYVLLTFSEQHASGEICVFRYKGKTYINQIKKIGNKLVAISLNPKYKPIILDPDEYIFLAVVTSIHRSVNRR